MPRNDEVVQRLRTSLGHLEAVIRMTEDQEPTIGILHQLSAIQGALNGVRRRLLEALLLDHLQPVVSAPLADDLTRDFLAATFGGPPSSRDSDRSAW